MPGDGRKAKVYVFLMYLCVRMYVYVRMYMHKFVNNLQFFSTNIDRSSSRNSINQRCFCTFTKISARRLFQVLVLFKLFKQCCIADNFYNLR